MDTHHIVSALRQHEAETDHPLPAPVYEIAYREWDGQVVDLQDGSVFTPRPNWADFTRRWAAERRRKGRPLFAANLATAILRTGELPPGVSPIAVAYFHLANVSVVVPLAQHWPSLEPVPEGRDVFAQYPVSGAPAQ